MATNFPSGLDSLTNPASGDSLASPSHSAQHADANDAIEALQAKVGVNSSAVATSLDYKVTDLDGRVDALEDVPLNAQTGTTYTLVASDAGKFVTLDNAAAITLTVPASWSAGTGSVVHLMQKGAGQVTVAGDTGVTVNTQGAKDKIKGQWGVATLLFLGSDEWVFFGNTAV